jgi:sec-independent protein translocase protein TatB
VLDIGFGELVVIAILALLVFGPDRLPKVASDAARTLRQVREMASAARRDLADAAGLQEDPELAAAVRDIRDLDPRRALRGLADETPAPAAGAPRPVAAPPTSPPLARTAAQGETSAQPAAESAAQPAAESAAQPAAEPVAEPVAQPSVDPDWT